MNPIAAIVAALVSLKDELYTKFNAALAKLPPLDQLEGGNAVLNVIREVEWAGERMNRVGADLQTTIDTAAQKLSAFERKANEPLAVAAARLLETLLDDAGTAAIGAAIAAKTHLPVEDHQTAIDQAREDGRKLAETEFNARVQSLQTLATRRAEAIEKLGAEAAATLSDADLLAETHAANIAAVAERITTLEAAGITHATRPRNFVSLLSCGLDDTGKQQFEARLEMLKEATVIPTAAAAPDKPAPATPAGTLPATTPAKDAAAVVI